MNRQPGFISMTRKKLIKVLDDLVAKGNTVIVIEHTWTLSKSADYLIDIGPDGGEAAVRLSDRDTGKSGWRCKKLYRAVPESTPGTCITF